MIWLDNAPEVLEWASEETVIPYVSRLDGRTHRYFVDFWAKIQQPNGEIKKVLLEVKPKKETKPPRKPKGTSVESQGKYMAEMATFVKNTDKWTAAQEYCRKTQSAFYLITEDTLQIKKK